YKHSEYIRLMLRGTISDAMDENMRVSNAAVEIYIKDKVTNEKILVKTVRTDSLGNYSTSVEPGQDYFVVAKKDDFLGTSGDVTTQGINASSDLQNDFKMISKPKAPIHIPNVKYQFDRSEIEASSKTVLDTTVLVLMELNPELVIEIMAHTDSKGADAYNLKLSQKRAESV